MILFQCSKCGQRQPKSAFYVYQTGKLRFPCKSCNSSSQRSYRHTTRGRTALAGALARYRMTEKYKRTRMQYLSNVEARSRLKINDSRYRKTTKGKLNKKQRAKRYHESPKGKNQRRIRAHLKTGRKALRVEDWRKLLDIFLHRCAYCGRSDVRLTQDHILPLSKGGKHILANIAPACQSCNSIKGTFVPAGLVA